MSDAGTEGASDPTSGATPTEPPESAAVEESDADAEAAAPAPDVESSEASDAFEALGNEVRMAVLRALAGGETEGDAGEGASDPPENGTMTFSELFEVSPADTTAGFAYHLRQLTDRFVRRTGEDDDRYALTYAGSQVARAIAAGTYTDRVSFGPVPTGDACPLCASGDLAAVCEANTVTVACDDCGRGVLTLPFPPGARRNRDPERLLSAFDRHHRHRLSVMSDGVCPECAATMDAALASPPDAVTERLPDSDAERAQVRLDCAQCGCRLHAPVTLAVLEHPAVVAFFHDHSLNVRDRPIWNVGDEWTETVVSDDPWCVRVGVELDDEQLDVFVDGDCSVAGTRRRDAAESRQAS
ncbi:helix-turn-helix domain-containing protein [Halorussus gelatinilyticus]|uniref:Helix-turn-helix domain-containing protein n=1 Tax=Halorussus gelatinilyticus TaxID=2937524 RepID=A0A8U0IKP3_9EURY|nr:helix-turn-helix domain-containing protein [Halorussus gelatinilyticus]UPW00784.1 helix-turn-helix domain-containing protein [Halorussus gelatinilyticus]